MPAFTNQPNFVDPSRSPFDTYQVTNDPLRKTAPPYAPYPGGPAFSQLDSNSGQDQLHAKQIAADIAAAAKAQKLGGATTTFPVAKEVLSAKWLEQAITGIGEDLTMQGAPQIEIDFKDTENFDLLNSGLFDPVGNPDGTQAGRLALIDINYPAGSKYWWGLMQVAPQADYVIQTFWLPRVVRDLMFLTGPVSANRAKVTRAEFIKSLCSKVPEINFYSKQLYIEQPVGNVTIPAPTGYTKKAAVAASYVGGTHTRAFKLALDRAGAINPLQPFAGFAPTPPVPFSPTVTAGPKQVGLTPVSIVGLTVKGQKMTQAQAQQANILLQVADQQAAGAVVTTALIFAGIWESGLSASPGNGSYWGCLSGSVNQWAQNDTAGMAKAFILGGGGFSSARQWAKQSTNPAYVASHAEGAIPFDQNGVSQQYESESAWTTTAAAINEAAAIVQRAGGATGVGGTQAASTEQLQQYNFTVGTTANPHESYWTAINRLAQEVNWEIVVDGPDVFYDSDLTLTRSQPREVLVRTDPQVDDWNYDWDTRAILTNFQLVLTCNPFDYAPGDVFLLVGSGWGPAARGSTLDPPLPGRWLVSEIQRNPGDIISTLTLVQPVAPLKEPSSTPATSLTSGNAVGTVLAAVNAAQRLSASGIPYSLHHRTLTKQPQPGGYDCSASVSWVLLTAGFTLPNGVSWNEWAPVSGDYETWGAAGPGNQMTIWTSGFHVFIEFNVPNLGHYQLNTSYPSSAGRNYGSGPYFFPWGPNGSTDAVSGAFKARHWPGT